MSLDSDIRSIKSDISFISFVLLMYLLFSATKCTAEFFREVKEEVKIKETK